MKAFNTTCLDAIFGENSAVHSLLNGLALKGLTSPINSVSRSQIPINVNILNKKAMFTLTV